MCTPGNEERKPTNLTKVDVRLRRPGSVSYLHIPASDVREAASFYQKVFGWNIHGPDTDRPGFEDGTGHLGGAWVTNQKVSREPGLLPYIYVERIHETMEEIVASGGEVILAPYPEGNLWVATFRDPAGNVMGLWQQRIR